MPRQTPIPNTGINDINNIVGWNTISRAIGRARNLTWDYIPKQIGEYKKISRENEAARTGFSYDRFGAGLRGIQSNIRGKYGYAVDSGIENFFKKVQAGGGAKMDKADLSKAIGELQKVIGQAAHATGGIRGDYLKNLAHTLKDAKKEAASEGFAGLDESSEDIIQQAFGLSQDNTIQDAQQDLSAEISNTAKAIGDPALKQALKDVRDDMNRAAKAAADTAEKQKVLADAATKLEGLAGSATGGDKATLEALSKAASKNTSELSKALRIGTGKNMLAGFYSKMEGFTHAIGAAGRHLMPLKRTFDVGIGVFQSVNSHFNQFARAQMKIASERGAYGRQMRGAAMNFGDVMSALGTGRRAGMDDATVVNKMTNLQVELAKARWGEGSIIESMGKWGLTPFNAEGGMKTPKQVMIDISNKYNSIGDELERLQFLTHMGYSPDQAEYIKNYAKDTEEWEFKKKNPHLMGILDQARILDESGLYAKADAATKIELKRRQILNQNAIDEGIWTGFVRQLNPENWFFNDWTARQQGVKEARSEKAIDELTKELVRVRGSLKENKGGMIGLSRSLSGMGEEFLDGLSLTGGWAQADLKDKGIHSSVRDMRALYARRMGLENLDDTEARNKRANALAGGVSGAAGGAVAGAVVGSIVPFIGTAVGAIVGAIIGALGGGVGGYSSPLFELADDGSQEHIDTLRELAKSGDEQALNKYIEEHHLWGLDADVINSDVFKDDSKAKQILQGAYFTDRLVSAQSLTGQAIDINQAKLFNQDRFYQANKKAAQERGEELSEERAEEAIARTGTGDETIGIDNETAYNYVMFGYNKNDRDNQIKIRKEKNRLRQEQPDRSAEEYQRLAEEKVEREWYENLSPELYQQALDYSKEVSDSKRAEVENTAKEDFKAIHNEAKEANVSQDDLEWVKAHSGAEMDEMEKHLERSIAMGGVTRHFEAQLRNLRAARKLAQIDGMSQDEFVAKEKQRMGVAEAQDRIQEVFGAENTPFALKKEEDQRAEVLEEIERQKGGLSLGANLARMATNKKMSLGKMRDLLFTDEEAAEIEQKLANGETLDTATQAKWVEYQKGDKAKARAEQKQEEEAQKQEDKIKAQQELSALNYIESSGVELTDREKERKAELQAKVGETGNVETNAGGKNEQSKPEVGEKAEATDSESTASGANTKEQPTEDTTAAKDSKEAKEKDRERTAMVRQAIKTIVARGGDVSKFSASDVEAYRQDEAKEKKLFTQENGLGDEAEYEYYKAVERAVLNGENVSAADRAMYDEKKAQLETLEEETSNAEFIPLHDEYEPTEDEQADIDHTLAVSKQLQEEREAEMGKSATVTAATASTAKGAETGGKGTKPLAEISDMRRMADLKERGGYTDEQLKEEFGDERFKQFKDAESSGELKEMLKGQEIGETNYGIEGAPGAPRKPKKVELTEDEKGWIMKGVEDSKFSSQVKAWRGADTEENRRAYYKNVMGLSDEQIEEKMGEWENLKSARADFNKKHPGVNVHVKKNVLTGESKITATAKEGSEAATGAADEAKKSEAAKKPQYDYLTVDDREKKLLEDVEKDKAFGTEVAAAYGEDNEENRRSYLANYKHLNEDEIESKMADWAVLQHDKEQMDRSYGGTVEMSRDQYGRVRGKIKKAEGGGAGVAAGTAAAAAATGEVPDATAVMQGKAKGVEQAIDKAAATSAAAESAAASGNAKPAAAAPEKGGEKPLNIQVGGVTVNQTINGELPIDADGIKEGTRRGATSGMDEAAEAMASTMKSAGTY